MFRIWVCFWFAVCGGAAVAQPAKTGAERSSVVEASDKRFALVIGNSAYKHMGVLANPVNDARELAATLQKIAVSVEVVLDADRGAMIAALSRLSRAAEDADLVIIHFSGHGIEINGSNYLLPVSAALNQPGDAGMQAIAFEQVYAAISHVRGVKVILLDACRDNPIAGQLGLPRRRGLAAPSPPKDTLVAYATRHGEVAEDGPPGSTSPFTGALIKNIEEPIDIRVMFQKVRDDVLIATKFRQGPFTYGHLSGPDYQLAHTK